MRFDLEGSGKILARTPRLLRTLLEALPDALVRANYGAGTWSPHEVVGHLIHGERTDWIPRTRWILVHGEALAFEPFDRDGHAALCRDHTSGELLDLFATLREANLTALRALALSEEDLARRGRHPTLGAVTLSQLLATWVAHDLNHIAQVCKALAFQHQREVGPGEAFLSILAPPSPR
jgi:hypothetical protein